MTCFDRKLDYTPLPEHLRGGVRRYIEQHYQPGDFLTAVISNDLRESFGRADETSRAALLEIVRWFYMNAPAASWGSRENMHEWLALAKERKRGD